MPLNYFSNLPLINCEIEFNLPWSKNCIISEISKTSRIPASPDANPPVQEVSAIQPTGPTSQISSAKLDVPVVTLSINDNFTFLENMKQGFKRIISCNKYRSKITAQPKTII